jgi:hypothetical protein
MLQSTKSQWTPARRLGEHGTLPDRAVYTIDCPSGNGEAPGVFLMSKHADAIDSPVHTMLRPGDILHGIKGQIQFCGDMFTYGALLDSFDDVARHSVASPSVENTERTWSASRMYNDMRKEAGLAAPIDESLVISYRPKRLPTSAWSEVRVGGHSEFPALAAKGTDAEFKAFVFANASSWIKLKPCVVYGEFSEKVFVVYGVVQTYHGVPIEGIAKFVYEPEAITALLEGIVDVRAAPWAADSTEGIHLANVFECKSSGNLTMFPVLFETDQTKADIQYWHEFVAFAFISNCDDEEDEPPTTNTSYVTVPA